MESTDRRVAREFVNDDDGEEFTEDDEQEEREEEDRELEALKRELDDLEGKIQEEKTLSDKADAARRIALEQKTLFEEQLEQKKQELVRLEKESEGLMVEGRMHQLASREYDFPLKDTWVNNPEQALVVDLSKISRNLEQAIRSLQSKESGSLGWSSSGARSTELEVIHVNSKGLELAKTNIPIGPTSTLGEVLNAACNYWSLNPESCELENSQGRKLVRQDVVSADTKQLILKDRLTEEEDREQENFTGEADMTEDGSQNNAKEANELPIQFNAAMEDALPSGENIHVGKDSITSRDSRICYHIEFLIVVLLATTFVSMTLEFRRVGEGFEAREAVKRLFADQPVIALDANIGISSSSFNFFKVYTENDMWQWITQAAALFAMSRPLTDLNCSVLNLNSTLGMTALTVSQLRVPPNSGCSQVLVNGSPQTCFPPYSGPQVPVDFANPVTDPLVKNAFIFNATQQAWAGSCTAWPSLVTDTFPGLYSYYGAQDLNYYSLPLGRSTAISQVSSLQQNQWIDASTRMIAVEFTTFEWSSGVFVNTIATFEYLSNGAIFPRWNSIPFFVQVNDDSYDLVFLILSVLVIGISFLGYFLFGFFGIMQVFLDAILLVFVAMYFAANQQLDSWFQECQTELQMLSIPSTAAFDFRGVAFQTQLIGNFQGIIIVLFAIRLVKFLSSSPSSSLLLRAIHKTSHQYISLYFLTIVSVSCFALMAHFIFGRSSFDFYVVDLAYSSLWISFAVGNSAAYVGTANWGAIVLSVAAFIVLFLVLLFIWFAVSASAYFSVRDEVRSRGYHWMIGSRAAQRYADDISAVSGAIKGDNASIRLKSHLATKRSFGQI